jgi:hypothetical protein
MHTTRCSARQAGALPGRCAPFRSLLGDDCGRGADQRVDVTSPSGTSDGVQGRSLPTGGVIACVVDDRPRFHLEALRWFACLTEVAGVDAPDLVVQVVGPIASEPLLYLERQGATIRRIDRFDSRSPHCNKIAGALRLAQDAPDGVVVLTDADTAILDDPRQIERPNASLSAKTVDSALPPIEVLTRIFKTAGVPIPPDVAVSLGPDQRTLRGNCNGGMYLLDGALLPQVASAWSTWARWLLDRAELLEDWAVHVDQVAMALVLAAEAIEWHPLDVGWNTPTHYPALIPPDGPRPHVLHYHWEVDHNGFIKPVGQASIDAQIEIANAAIRQAFNAAAPSATLRQWRAEIGAAPARQADPGPVLASLAASLGLPRILETVASPSPLSRPSWPDSLDLRPVTPWAGRQTDRPTSPWPSTCSNMWRPRPSIAIWSISCGSRRMRRSSSPVSPILSKH